MKYVEKYVGGFILLIVTAVSTLPFIYMLILSFKDTLSAYNFNLDGLTPKNYIKILNTAEFGRCFFNSVFVALAGVALAVVVSCLAGYAFAKLKFPGNDTIFFLLIMTLIIPSEVIIVPLYLIIKNLDWLNTYQALILPLPTALGTFIMRQAILAVPNELMDAAKIEGCSNQDTMEDYHSTYQAVHSDAFDFYIRRRLEQLSVAAGSEYEKRDDDIASDPEYDEDPV